LSSVSEGNPADPSVFTRRVEDSPNGQTGHLPREQVRYWLENRRKECPRTPFLDVMKTIHI
jgi:hypothetical protein